MGAYREAGTPEPEVSVEQTGLWVTFPFLAEHSQTPHQRISGEVAGQATGEVTRLLLVADGEQSRTALHRRLGLSGRANFLRLYLEPALEAGLLEMTIADKPQSRLQKYRLTDKGWATLAALEERGAAP